MFNIEPIIRQFDQVLRVMAGVTPASRQNPAKNLVGDAALTEQERRHSAGLMRVNHVGEVCAQALYQAQSQVARNPTIAHQFLTAGQQEQDHLGWTSERLKELGARPSLFNPGWYLASYVLGSVAGRMGDATSLGFVVETESQVEAHLTDHLNRLPPNDLRSRAIVEQMRQDEQSHGQHAQSLGAKQIPAPIKLAMQGMSRVMTTVAYYI